MTSIVRYNDNEYQHLSDGYHCNLQEVDGGKVTACIDAIFQSCENFHLPEA